MGPILVTNRLQPVTWQDCELSESKHCHGSGTTFKHVMSSRDWGKKQIIVFWGVLPHSTNVFGGICSFHLQGRRWIWIKEVLDNSEEAIHHQFSWSLARYQWFMLLRNNKQKWKPSVTIETKQTLHLLLTKVSSGKVVPNTLHIKTFQTKIINLIQILYNIIQSFWGNS
jgi:hypothetical protein